MGSSLICFPTSIETDLFKVYISTGVNFDKFFLENHVFFLGFTIYMYEILQNILYNFYYGIVLTISYRYF